MNSDFYCLRIGVPKDLRVDGEPSDREAFYYWVWNHLGNEGLLGVHEGTVLTEDVDTENQRPWVMDQGIAPVHRDWVGSRNHISAELYFESEDGVKTAAKALEEHCPEVVLEGIRNQKQEDWDALWKQSFKGIEISPFWHVLPPWESAAHLPIDDVIIRVNPGAGFGTGTHETTQLCLQALADFSKKRRGLGGLQVLDFGSGSGILSIAAAKLGAQSTGVEIDPLAIENAKENASLNFVESSVHWLNDLSQANRTYSVVMANILKPVLLENAKELVARLDSRSGVLILSGLLEKDVPAVTDVYQSLLPDHAQLDVLALGEWRALIWEYSQR